MCLKKKQKKEVFLFKNRKLHYIGIPGETISNRNFQQAYQSAH